MKTNSIINWVKDTALGFLDFLFPIGCVNCNAIGQGYLCHACFQKVIFIEEPYCKHCGLPIEKETDKYCSRCIFDFGFHDGGFAIAIYEEPISSLIHNLKYQRETDIAKFLASFAVSRLKNLDKLVDLKCDIVHPVPLFPKRKSSRGFNQSALIAEHIASDIGIQYAENILIRIRDTKSQTGLSVDERISNVKNAFAIKDGSIIKGRSFLLIDDVMTTGSTIQECARTLKNADASSVKFLTIARQPLDYAD